MYKPLIHSKSITELHKNKGLDAPSNPLISIIDTKILKKPIILGGGPIENTLKTQRMVL